MEIEITDLWIEGNIVTVGSLVLCRGIRQTYPPSNTHKWTVDRLLHRGSPNVREQIRICHPTERLVPRKNERKGLGRRCTILLLKSSSLHGEE